MTTLSIVIPAKNESAAIGKVVADAVARYPDVEVIVVDDGSTDDTATVAREAGAKVVQHPESLGNGAAVKAGARAATGELIAFMDGDGQHDAAELAPLLERIGQGYDMAIGARNSGSHANVGRLFANGIYNAVASLLTGRNIPDLTSGFRVARASLFKQFLYLLPNGFSYPTTITMAFLRSGYPICFEPIPVADRIGKSHIRPLRDGIRFLVIIFKIATLYSPL
ncbi:MAG TPA: glycosyltransferase family 2 protein, partial [Woeseiaceae bacterium]